MSDKPRLPDNPHAQETYEGRFAARVSRELTELKSKQRLSYEDRIASQYSATAAPTGGNWVAGDRLRNSAPAEAGVALSKYVVIGWICTVTGNPGTWLEMRVLTGN